MEEAQSIVIFPGYVCVPKVPTLLRAVVASGIVVTLYDTQKKMGGICYYTHAIRENNSSSPRFAAPAILSMIELMEKSGCTKKNMECYLYGGATNKKSLRYQTGISEHNSMVGKEILQKIGIMSFISNTGGILGRKIVFHSGTGEAMVAHVHNVRKNDWYPTLTMKYEKR